MREENTQPDDTSALTREERSIYAQVSRRGFMGATAAATLAALAGREPRLVAGPQRKATADAVIVLWMAGGMAQTETFDPKRYTPFAPGVNIKDVLSTFPTIPTVVDNIKFTKGLEQIASVMDRGTIIRTFNAADLGFILHSRHQYHWHTGYIPPQPMAMPHLGAVISKTLGPRNPDVPAFIAIGQTVEGPGEIGTLKAFHTVGLPRLRPRAVPDRRSAGRRVRRPPAEGAQRGAVPQPPGAVREAAGAGAGLSIRRRFSARVAREVARRRGSAAALAVGEGVRPVARAEEELRRLQHRAASGRAACWRGGSSKRARATSRSRRSTSRSSTGTATRTATSAPTAMKKLIDAPIAQLVRDLEERGLLDRTLVVLASEFGRDAMTEGKVGKEVKDQAINIPDVMTEPRHYGMHRHFTAAGSILMFGGGIKKGFVYGKTAEERPCTTIENPVIMEDLHATIYHALGIAPDTSYVVERRPVYVTNDGKGEPILDLFA